MLQKRRTIASIPDGLCDTAKKIRKGRCVIRKYDTKKKDYVFDLPSSADEAKTVYGFITLRIDEDTHKESYYDDIDAGKKAVVYTLVPNESWGTTEFEGSPVIGDKMIVDSAGENAGKLKVAGSSDTAQFEVVAVYPALGGYEEPMIDVRVL